MCSDAYTPAARLITQCGRKNMASFDGIARTTIHSIRQRLESANGLVYAIGIYNIDYRLQTEILPLRTPEQSPGYHKAFLLETPPGNMTNCIFNPPIIGHISNEDKISSSVSRLLLATRPKEKFKKRKTAASSPLVLSK
jgi:hypothetical protein